MLLASQGRQLFLAQTSDNVSCVHRYRRRELQFMGQLQRCSFLLYPAVTLHYLLQVRNSQRSKLHQTGCRQCLMHSDMLAGSVQWLIMMLLPVCRRPALW